MESSQFGIFLKQNDGVIYTVIADLQYPAKLASLYLDCIIGAFADELKTLYGASTNVRSKLETIENSHHFVKFGIGRLMQTESSSRRKLITRIYSRARTSLGSKATLRASAKS